MKKLLIIEDDQIVGNIYRHRFQLEGFQVEVAPDGEAGLQAVHDFKPGVVVLDLMLPRVNGVEVIKQIRANPETQSLPVIVLSNAYLSNLVQAAWKAGANHCMIKASCTPKQLIELVHKTLSQGGEEPPPPSASAPAAPMPAASTPNRGSGNAVASLATSAPTSDDRAFQSELRQTFLGHGADTLSQVRTLLQNFVRSEGDASRLPALFAVYRKVHAVTSNAALAGLTGVAKMCSALEAFIKELYEKPRNINSSTVRTLAQTVDFLSTLFDNAASIDWEADTSPNILVVDDEAISRRAIIYALEKAHLKCASVEDPNIALKMLSENQFDLIFLDVDMPGLNGFDVCTKLRTFPVNAKTPVIFVTGLTDFESRVRSTLSGGNDLIAKPFLFMELAVKALSHYFKSRIDAARAKPEAT